MKATLTNSRITSLVLGVALLAGACGKGEEKEGERAESREAGKAESGHVIVVEAYSDANGNYFKPNAVEAHKGDVVRFTLKSGVHNVHFLPDSNPGVTGLPAASDMLQIPDQTYDFPVSLGKGKYYFQCDPHAALGMKGHLTVED